jgi:hypothetical protein
VIFDKKSENTKTGNRYLTGGVLLRVRLNDAIRIEHYYTRRKPYQNVLQYKEIGNIPRKLGVL